jgi:hypothetical protein
MESESGVWELRAAAAQPAEVGLAARDLAAGTDCRLCRRRGPERLKLFRNSCKVVARCDKAPDLLLCLFGMQIIIALALGLTFR